MSHRSSQKQNSTAGSPLTRRYTGRHVARRRHIVGPVLLTGVLATTTVVSAAPQTAASRGRGSEGTTPAATATDRTTDRTTRVSRSTERTPVYRVVPGRRFRERPPSYVLPVSGYHLTGRFGQVSGLWAHTHTGLDFAAPEGTEIRSIAAGTVVSTAYDGAYGNKTVVRLADGTVLWYCHQSSEDVRPGQRVSMGQVIGHVGSTGNVTGPHLHLEVHPHGGGPIDPEDWLPAHGLHP